ncbi:uncharacterized protein EAE98_004967 [Botrytis deweyae]|uniref:Uncharacterized protein n=1 Tax=Botrytis deweyae TaxID=2478750 RepID=A0ABQ7IPV2_9HELO|nr:uncharacterized protein EAE98_004967 [Botrytis deweyae]KAF7930567.1 hypothetical protein EAE98_004967 [Botrytis deweyae]
MLRYINRVRQLFELYGSSAIPLFVFGSRTTWCMQAKVLGELKEGQDRPDNSRATEFKNSTLAECNMVAVAAAVVAQIAVTGLSLELSNQAYCLTKTSFVPSLIFAILAVFYVSCLQRRFNRLLTGEDIRRWIRGSSRKPGAKRWVWSVDEEIKARCFIPSASSVITASAPQLLLSISLTMLVIALGVYLGNFGTAEPSNTKFVFALYIIGLVFFGGAYSMAQYFDIEEICSEIDIINGYLTGWSERMRRDQAKNSQPPDPEGGNTEDSISKSGSEASSRSKSSIKGKERVGKKD